jgi:nicotinic acid phosphoribosyltransferase
MISRQATDKTLVEERASHITPSYAQVFSGIRQDSGNPEHFVKLMREFYDREGIHGEKDIVFSDSLDIELCFKYQAIAETFGFKPKFGIGTFLTSKKTTHTPSEVTYL